MREKMETLRFEFLLEAQTPIAHASETMGNQSFAMRRKVRLQDGSFADVPVITGDTMRHGMREASAYAFLDAAGLLHDGNLTENALRLLFAGGMVSGRGDGGTINLDQYRELCELCPPLALFGGCASNRVIPGRLFVDDAVLVCQENQRYLPEWTLDHLKESVLSSSRAHVEEAQRVRMDPTLDPGKRKLLSTGDQIAANARLLKSESAHASDSAIEREETKSSMLPRTFERVVQGSMFYWSVQAHTYGPLDVDVLHTALGVFLSNPTVGGKRATGHGKLRVVTARQIAVARPSERADVIDTTALAGRTGDLFRSHVRERAERIKKFLCEVDA